MCVWGGGCQELRSHWSIKGKSLKGHTEFDTSLPATHSNKGKSQIFVIIGHRISQWLTSPGKHMYLLLRIPFSVSLPCYMLSNVERQLIHLL